MGKDTTEINSVLSIFPDTRILLCLWHVKQAVTSRMTKVGLLSKKCDPHKAPERFPFISTDFVSIINAKAASVARCNLQISFSQRNEADYIPFIPFFLCVFSHFCACHEPITPRLGSSAFHILDAWPRHSLLPNSRSFFITQVLRITQPCRRVGWSYRAALGARGFRQVRSLIMIA